MKFLKFIIIGCAAIMSVNAMNDEMKDMVRSVAQDCKKSEGADDSDVEKIVNEEYPITKQGYSCKKTNFQPWNF